MSLTLARPWLEFDLGAEMEVLSFAPYRPGPVRARRILWREVRDADLPEGLDAVGWLAAEMAARGAEDGVAMLTSRRIDAYETAEVTVEGVTAMAVATVGLSNAERIGTRLSRPSGTWGTINIALRLDTGLTPAALIELLTIAAEARTAAVIEAGLDLPTGRATGTGTDCIAVAAPAGGAPFAGLHTAIGEAAGRAVNEAVARGARAWVSGPGARNAAHARSPLLNGPDPA